MKGVLQPVFSVPPCPRQFLVLFSPELHFFHSSLSCQPRTVLSASMVGVLATAVHATVWNRIQTLGGELGAWGRPVRYTWPRSSRGNHCSAGLISSSARDLRIQSQRRRNSILERESKCRSENRVVFEQRGHSRFHGHLFLFNFIPTQN